MITVAIMEDDADTQAMAQAMGFSGFGSQDPPSKKRRYNPHSDASLPASMSSNLHKRGPAASGANSAPLGPPRSATNTEEISLDDDDEDGGAAQEGGADKEEGRGLASLPQRPAVATEESVETTQGQGHAGRGGRGQFNPLWYENYYDPSSNANPWDRLEKKLNLQPRDMWPPQSQISQQPATAPHTTTTTT